MYIFIEAAGTAGWMKNTICPAIRIINFIRVVWEWSAHEESKLAVMSRHFTMPAHQLKSKRGYNSVSKQYNSTHEIVWK